MSELTTFLINVSNPDPKVRIPAEEMLEKAKTENFPQYITLLSQELRDEAKPSASRQLAGIQIKNALSGKSREFIELARQRWLTLAPDVKATVRANCLESLRSANPDVRKVGPQAISAIALLDLPLNEWPDLLPGLCAAASKPTDGMIRISALKTIEYICYEIDPDVVAPIMGSVVKAVVEAAEPTEQDPVVKCAGLSAFTTLVDGIEEIFKREQERNYLMNVLLQAANDQDPNIQSKALENLESVTWSYYPFMKPYIDVIFKVTVSRMNQCDINNNDDDIVLKSIDIWAGIAEKETELDSHREDNESDADIGLLGITAAALSLLVPPLTHCLTLQDEEYGTWNVASAAAECLALMAQCTKNAIVGPVMTFVNAGLVSPDWHQREAALTAFSSIVDGPPIIAMNLTTTPALNYISNLMNDENECVRAAAVWTAGRICHTHPTVVADPTRLNPIIERFVLKLRDTPRVATQACSALESLADIFKNVATSPLSLKFTEVAQSLLQAAEVPDGEEYSLSSTAYSALNTLVRHSTKDCTGAIAQLANEAAARLTKLLEATAAAKAAGTHVDDAMMDELQYSVCGVLNECVQKLGEAISDGTDPILLLLNTLFANGAGAHAKAEAITGIGYLVAALGAKFLPYTEKIIPGLTYCVSLAQEPELCKAALIAISEIARVPELAIVLRNSVTTIIPAMGQTLTSPATPQELRPVILATYGDIVLFMENAFVPYLNDLVQVLAQASAVAGNTDDEDQLEYVNTLRSSVLEVFTSIIQSVSVEAVAPLVRTILDSVYNIFTDYDANYDSTLLAVVGVIGDLASRFKNNFSRVVTQDDPVKMKSMVGRIRSDINTSGDKKATQLIKWTDHHLKSAFP